MKTNRDNMGGFLRIACKWGIYGALIGATIGTVAGCMSPKPAEWGEDQVHIHGYSGGYVSIYAPDTTKNREQAKKDGFEVERWSDVRDERMLRGAGAGALFGALLFFPPFIISLWYLFLVMLGQVSEAIRGSKPSHHNVNVRLSNENHQD